MLEAVYSGNMGFMEMIKFMDVASENEKHKMERFLEADKWDKAWSLLQNVTGVKFKDPRGKWSPRG